MPERPPVHRPQGWRSAADRRREWDRHRPNATERGYGARWRKARAVFLAEHPTCSYCAERGVLSAANVVDHVVPHKGDQTLFWDVDNWRAACQRCHNSRTAAADGGYGNPVKPK